jgi:hypothetical protein
MLMDAKGLVHRLMLKACWHAAAHVTFMLFLRIFCRFLNALALLFIIVPVSESATPKSF